MRSISITLIVLQKWSDILKKIEDLKFIDLTPVNECKNKQQVHSYYRLIL
jgi:hypothetical protein